MRYILKFYLLILFTFTIYFEDGHYEQFEDCYIPEWKASRYENRPVMKCAKEINFWAHKGVKEFSLFDKTIKNVVET